MPAEVEDLEQASRMTAKVAWGDEPGVTVGEAIEAMERSRNMTDAALLMAVRSFSARGEHRADGRVNVAAYLQHACRLKKRQALRIARLARFPDTYSRLRSVSGMSRAAWKIASLSGRDAVMGVSAAGRPALPVTQCEKPVANP